MYVYTLYGIFLLSWNATAADFPADRNNILFSQYYNTEMWLFGEETRFRFDYWVHKAV